MENYAEETGTGGHMKKYLQKYAEELCRIRNRARLRQYAALLKEREEQCSGRSDLSAGRDRKQNR